jgi:argininosuccinate lyase
MTLWGGRFEEAPADALWRFTVDDSDRRLLADDVAGSLAHASVLGEAGLLSTEEAALIRSGLEQVHDEAESGSFIFVPTDEDVHTAVERRLGELVGAVSGKLHMGRSRNDQVALDVRLYLRRAAGERIKQLRQLIGVLVDAAVASGETVVPSFTHLQQAQAVPFAHHLLAHAWAMVRDVQRFAAVRVRLDVSPLGAGASGGSSLPLRPYDTARLLDFADLFDNSLDAVAARDVVTEYAFCCAQAMTTLSRLAEELVLWGTEEFGWATFDDRFTTGSSALPHKKNPDVAELVRGKAAAVAGDVTTLLALQKGLPLSYNRDLQEDKRAVFHADDSLGGACEALSGMVETAWFHPPDPSPWVTALDLAEVLVQRGVPFREAHEAVGGLVAALNNAGRSFADVSAGELEAAHPQLVPEDMDRLSPRGSVDARATPGGGSPSSVARQIERLRRLLDGG